MFGNADVLRRLKLLEERTDKHDVRLSSQLGIIASLRHDTTELQLDSATSADVAKVKADVQKQIRDLDDHYYKSGIKTAGRLEKLEAIVTAPKTDNHDPYGTKWFEIKTAPPSSMYIPYAWALPGMLAPRTHPHPWKALTPGTRVRYTGPQHCFAGLLGTVVGTPNAAYQPRYDMIYVVWDNCTGVSRAYRRSSLVLA